MLEGGGARAGGGQYMHVIEYGQAGQCDGAGKHSE
jgi:hypothetical protein